MTNRAMRTGVWSLAHAAAFVALHGSSGCFAADQPNTVLYAMPVVAGVVQLLFLGKQLRWWGLLWLPACYAGMLLSFAGCWWFLFVLGAGFGVAQAPVLLAAGFRRVWAWPAASALGWFAGMMAGGWSMDAWVGADAGEHVKMSVLYGMTAMGYGAATGFALLVMKRAEDHGGPPGEP